MGVGIRVWVSVSVGVDVGVRALIGDGVAETAAPAFSSFSASIICA